MPVSSPEGAPGKLVVDSIHGDVHLSDQEWRVLDTLPFQRLRGLKQLGMGQVTYPNATHTRFAHSLGTLHIMTRILSAARANGYSMPALHEENLRLAALLHDVGHYPYSHLMERIDNVILTEEAVDGSRRKGRERPFDASHRGYPSHEELGAEIVTRQPDLVRAIGDRSRARQVADLFTRSAAADPQLSKLLHSSFDMDRLDYLQRDSRAAGVPYGNIDLNYLLNSLRVSPTRMVGVAEKALPAAEQFLLARFFMHKTVYYHKTTYAIEEACRQLLRRIRDQRLFGIPCAAEDVIQIVRSPDLANFTDSYVDQLIHKAMLKGNRVMKALALCIQSRRPPKLLKEVQVFEDAGHASHHAGVAFIANARSSLKSLAKKYDIPLGQFLLCHTKPLKLEERGPLLTNEEARHLQPEEKDELIKVFVGSDAEPKSLVDIQHSLINACAGRFWQAFRLYVVYEGSDSGDVIKRLRADVRAWNGASR